MSREQKRFLGVIIALTVLALAIIFWAILFAT
jgi:hypothetical protein